MIGTVVGPSERGGGQRGGGCRSGEVGKLVLLNDTCLCELPCALHRCFFPSTLRFEVRSPGHGSPFLAFSLPCPSFPLSSITRMKGQQMTSNTIMTASRC